MKIAFLSCVYPPYPGGIGVSAFYTAQGMARRGHEVHVFTPQYNKIRNPKSEIRKGEPTVHYLRPLIQYGNAGLLLQLLWKLKSFDVVHCYYPFYGGLEIAALAKKQCGFKFFVHHEMDAVGQGMLKKIFAWHFKYIIPWVLKRTDKFLILSEDYFNNSPFFAMWNKEKYPPLEVVPNGVDVAHFFPVPNKILGNMPTIIMVSGLDKAHYFKGVSVLLNAIKILQDQDVALKCKIIGEGDLKDVYIQQAAEIGLQSVVEFTGLITHDNLPSVLQNADCFVMPSVGGTESFCIAAAEAMACGVPAIVTDLPGLRTTIKDQETGLLCKKGDAIDLAEKIKRIITDETVWSRMSHAARARMAEFFSWERICDILEKCYKEISHI